jgi:small-conductance mechanosensitive channel
LAGLQLLFAQKTVENLLGGIFLRTDKALAVGDTCCISNRQGTIEYIALRSVRLRTQEQTLLSIPAGALSQANIEKFRNPTEDPCAVHSAIEIRNHSRTIEIGA